MLSPRYLLSIAVLALGVLGWAGAARAATYTVNDTNDAALANPSDTNCASTDSGPRNCTLRAAVQAADNTHGANTINLPAGDYKLTIAPTCGSLSNGCDANDPTKGDLDVANTTLTIAGAGSSTTTVDANRVDRAFAVQNGSGLSLSGLTIQNGQPAYSGSDSLSSGLACGGAIYSDGALSTTGDVVMHDNNAVNYCEKGGAIYADVAAGSTLSLSGTTFTANNADCSGGAIYYDAPGPASITSSTFSGNYASCGEGGAIDGKAGSMNIDTSTFSSNGSNDGGAIYWDNTTDLAITNSTFQNNSAQAGGAIYDNDARSITLGHDLFTGNTADQAGVIYNDAQSADVYTFTSDEFDDNVANHYGVGAIQLLKSLTDTGSSYVDNSGADGGVWFLDDSSTTLSFTNDTMSNNTSDFGGALFYNTAMQTSMTNDTIAFNSATENNGGGITNAGDATVGSGSGITNTVVAENTGGDCANRGGTGSSQFAPAEDSGTNLDSDGSCFAGDASSDKVGVNPMLSAPADNGGSNVAGTPGSTERIQTDAEHSSGPSVDAGTNTACPATDARGVTRDNDPCDMGAFELVASGLGLAKSGPAVTGTNEPFRYTITASNAANAAGPASGTTVVDQLPAGETLYGATPSQGTCTASGSPAKVTCDLAAINQGSGATVTLTVTEANAGSVTNTASVADNEGQSATASATTLLSAPVAPAGATGPTATTGPAVNIKKTAATLTGTVVPGSQPTAYFFQYGTTKSYGKTSSIGHTGSSTQGVSAVVGGLSQATVIHYRLVAINDSGQSFGVDRTLRTQGTIYLGKLLLIGRTAAAHNGGVSVTFKCQSSLACFGLFSITAHVKVPKTHQVATVVCTQSQFARYLVPARSTRTVTVPVHQVCLVDAQLRGGALTAKVTTRPRSAQRGVVKIVTFRVT